MNLYIPVFPQLHKVGNVDIVGRSGIFVFQLKLHLFLGSYLKISALLIHDKSSFSR